MGGMAEFLREQECDTQSERKAPLLWRTMDGRLLRPQQMDTTHLLNTLNFIARRARDVLCNEAREQIKVPFTYFEIRNTLDAAFDNQTCRAFALNRWPIAKLLEEEFLRRQS